MKTNAESDVVKQIRTLNKNFETAVTTSSWSSPFSSVGSIVTTGLAAPIEHTQAKAMWAWLVSDARARPSVQQVLMNEDTAFGNWDYKPKIFHDKHWGVSQVVLFPTGEQIEFYYSIWGNIHYGYVGRAAGFSEETLTSWANYEHIAVVQSPSPESDTTSFEIGYTLYAEGKELTVPALLKQLYDHKCHLDVYNSHRPPRDRTYHLPC